MYLPIYLKRTSHSTYFLNESRNNLYFPHSFPFDISLNSLYTILLVSQCHVLVHVKLLSTDKITEHSMKIILLCVKKENKSGKYEQMESDYM